MSWEEFVKLNKVPEMYRNVSAKDSKLPAGYLTRGVEWAKSENPQSLFLFGDCGRGKTWFLYYLIRAFLTFSKLSDSLAQVRFFRSKQLDDLLLKNFEEFKSNSYTIETVAQVPVLFLDDFGVERGGERTERDYYDIIDERMSNYRTTVFSSNIDISKAEDVFGPRIGSRLKYCTAVNFKDLPDLRGNNDFLR